ncbi:MAG: hypothetical protein R2784_11905 [Saprospiraceae bacterium]
MPGPPGTISSNRQYLNTEWGRVPSGPIITEAFDNDPESRSSQDIGLDGLTDMEEAVQFAEYLNKIQCSNLLIRLHR